MKCFFSFFSYMFCFEHRYGMNSEEPFSEKLWYHLTKRPCSWCVGGQYNILFSRRIYMKIGFSSQMREMPKYTTKMAAVTSRANQQYSVVDMFLQLTRSSGFLSHQGSHSGACQLSAFGTAAVHICALELACTSNICKPCFFPQQIRQDFDMALWYRGGVSLKAYTTSMKGGIKIQSYFVTFKNYFRCKRT